MTVLCTLCKTEFNCYPKRAKAAKTGKLFCSRECKDKAQRLETGILKPTHYGSGCSYREIARRNLEQKCSHCGYGEYKEILQVHHKNKDRSDYRVENLEMLCPNCHALTHLKMGHETAGEVG